MNAIFNKTISREDVAMPEPGVAQAAALASRVLARVLPDETGPVRIRLLERGSEGEEVSLPAVAVKLLNGILSQLANGNAVTLMPIHAELTTQEAADLLNISRPFLVKLIERGDMPFHMAGTHRRILAKHVLAYRSEQRDRSTTALDEIAQIDHELDLHELPKKLVRRAV